MGRDTQLAELGSYAVHQVRDGWEIIAPSDDPITPAYWRVAVIHQHVWRVAGRDRDGDAPLSWGVVRCANRISTVK